MQVIIVAVLLGAYALASLAGGVTLTAISHPVPEALWTSGGIALGAVAALLVRPGGSSPPAVTNVTTSPDVTPTPTPPLGHDLSTGPLHVAAELPPPPVNRSSGRASPSQSSLPPRPAPVTKAQARARKTDAGAAKASARAR